MNCFSTTSLTPTTLDSHKRVNYSLGLVLGVDEFLQEQTYFMEGDRLHNRLLHGYGTLCGLQVSERSGASGPEILVQPGIAVDPQGQTINVPSPQCVSLNDWLGQEINRQKVEEASGSPPGPVELYVVLCYRECRTDNVPIPGSPCRTEEDSTSPSRIADDFELRLVTSPPDQAEEELVDRFGRLLDLIEIDGTATDFLSDEDLADLVRALAEDDQLPSWASPPVGSFILHPDTACEALQHAMHVWVTEVRGCDWTVEGQRCVRLAHLSFNTEEFGGRLLVNEDIDVDGSVTVDDETDRPLLLHTRLLHEWIACGRTASGMELLALDDLIDVDALPTAEGHIIIRRGLGWVSEELPASVIVHDELGGLSDDDHLQYFNEIRGDARYALLAHTHPGVTDHGGLTGLGDDDHLQYLNEARGDLRYAPINHAHGIDDLTDVISNPTVSGQILSWNQGLGQWTVGTIPPGPAGPQPTILPFATIRRLDNRLYEIWFNLDAPGNSVEIAELPPDLLLVQNETNATPGFLQGITVARIDRTRRNVFEATLQAEGEFMRFSFIMDLQLRDGRTLTEYVQDANVQFEGQNELKIITKFVHGSRN